MSRPDSKLDRAVAVVLHHGRLLVVRRARAGRASYAVLPGGGVEADESPPQACLRELAEKTGLAGRVADRLATLEHPDRTAHYFRVHVTDPVPPLALSGPEASRQSTTDRHEPAWVKVERLDEVGLLPSEVREHVARWAAPPAGFWSLTATGGVSWVQEATRSQPPSRE